MKKLYLLLLVLIVPCLSVAQTNEEFPGRHLYQDVKYIELKDLTTKYNDVIIVDVRSSYEFNTLHISNALNISFTESDFTEQIAELRTKNPNKPIVTYCNGKTCLKSYKAVRDVQQKGVKNVVAFDAGIMDWATTNPGLTALLGESPLNPANLIPKKEFQSHLLDPDKFLEAAAASKNALIVDARDPLQRDGVSFFIGKAKRASLEDTEAMTSLIEEAVKTQKTMYIYDEAGKQVEWLMYRIKSKGLKDFYFMKGGTINFFKVIRNELNQK